VRFRGSEVQSVLFDRDLWSEHDARKWAERHGFRAHELHATDDYLRARQFDPALGRDFRTVTISEGKGIKAVLSNRNPGELGELVRTERRSGAIARLYLIGEEADDFYRYRLFLDDEEILSVLWPDTDSEELWTHIADHWLLYWELHT